MEGLLPRQTSLAKESTARRSSNWSISLLTWAETLERRVARVTRVTEVSNTDWNITAAKFLSSQIMTGDIVSATQCEQFSAVYFNNQG